MKYHLPFSAEKAFPIAIMLMSPLLVSAQTTLIWDDGGANLNWSTVENWDTDSNPSGNNVEFQNAGKTAEGVVGNVVNADLTVNSLYYRNDAVNWQVTEILENATLTIDGTRLIEGVNAALSGGRAAEGSTVADARTQIFGQGALVIDSPTGSIDISGWYSTTTKSYQLLDMSGLANFTANVDTVYVGRNRYNRSFSGRLVLAESNIITANALYSGHSGGQGNMSFANHIFLGTENILNIDAVYVGANGPVSGQVQGELAFSDAVKTAGNGTVTIQGKGSTPGDRQRALMEIGSTNNGSAGIHGIADFTGGSVDAYLSDLELGKEIRGGEMTSTLRMDAGIIDALNINMGFFARDNPAAGTLIANATIDVLGGQLTTGSLMMVRGAGTATRNSDLNISGDGIVSVTGGGIQMANSTAGARNATINLDGGELSVAGDITKFGAAVNGVINMRGGLLDMGGNAIGGANAITLNAESGTLRGLAELNAGGDLEKTTAGTLVLEGVNSYTGATDVQAGELLVNGTLANSVTTVQNGATLGGSGTLGAAVSLSSGGILSPGTSPGTLTFSDDLTFGTNAEVAFELGSGGSDLIVFNGTNQVLSADGPLLWVFTSNGTVQLNTDYLLMDWSLATDFNGLGFNVADQVIANNDWAGSFSLDADGLSVSFTAIPEPGTIAALLGIVVFGVVMFVRRRR